MYKKQEEINNALIEFLNIENFIEIRNEITKSLQEKNNLLILDIVAICQIGEGAYYFPSEEFSDEKNKDSSKILFGILDKTNNKQAGIHSQKIGNAIRTIDCWYSEFKNNKVVLPIEPYGQQQSISKAWRNSTNKEDLYSILSRINNLNILEEKDTALFLLGCFIRGGVFSGGKK